MRLKIRGGRLTCKVSNKCLNVLNVRMEVVERNRTWSPFFPCCHLSGQKKVDISHIFRAQKHGFHNIVRDTFAIDTYNNSIHIKPNFSYIDLLKN